MDRAGRYTHLHALTDHQGLFEHALLDVPRREHGYCVDDVARALIVVVREPEQTGELAALTATYLAFLESAVAADGLVHNRMDAGGRWIDDAGRGDWWGRALWALGTAAARSLDPATRARARRAFERAAAADGDTPHLRTAAFAALGAAEIAGAHPDDPAARRLLVALAAAVPPASDALWPWPERRLTYANAVIPEALIAAGVALQRPAVTDRGLLLLGFLLGSETRGERLSVTGPGGRGAGERAAQFDQQPIEVAAIADACARAFAATGEPQWLRPVALAWAWFLGSNDSGTVMVDGATGAGFDGLERTGRNENRGAESTLAALSTFQQASRLAQLGAAA